MKLLISQCGSNAVSLESKTLLSGRKHRSYLLIETKLRFSSTKKVWESEAFVQFQLLGRKTTTGRTSEQCIAYRTSTLPMESPCVNEHITDSS